MNEAKAKRPSVSEIVFERLKHRIISKEWAPGDKLPSENKLSQEMGCSRVSIRAALQKLTSLGLVESRQGGGTYVCQLSVDQHLNSVLPYFALSRPDRASMFEFRYIIETESAALAAQRAEPSQIEAMHEATKKMAEATTIEDITKYDLDFHYLVAQASHNPILVKVFEILYDTYFATLRDNVTTMGSTGSTYHHMITVAIETRDAELAKLLMRKHLSNTMTAAVLHDQRDDTPAISDR